MNFVMKTDVSRYFLCCPSTGKYSIKVGLSYRIAPALHTDSLGLVILVHKGLLLCMRLLVCLVCIPVLAPLAYTAYYTA